jgi:demethylmenaquinone methyltransferase/2-methoxy-6-polyprenyl-1,4-benzoquinol methylase
MEERLRQRAAQVLPPPDHKARYVREMFTSIAPVYDRLNSVMSLGLHSMWRRRAVALSGVRPGDRALDVATGTGDFALALARRVGPTGEVIGTDFSEAMLELAAVKARQAGVSDRVSFEWADALDLPYEDGEFAAATVGFAGRNVTDLRRFFSELCRVVRPGGRVVHLELSRPTMPGFRTLYRLYFYNLVPLVGGALARSRAAYTYLPNSLTPFPPPEEISRLMREAGLKNVRHYGLALGTVTIHVGVSP